MYLHFRPPRIPNLASNPQILQLFFFFLAEPNTWNSRVRAYHSRYPKNPSIFSPEDSNTRSAFHCQVLIMAKQNWCHKKVARISDRYPEFFTVYIPHLCSQRLRLPPAFLKYFSGVVPKKVVFKDMKKQLYKVHVKKVEGDFYFIDGWEEFVNDQPIKLGDFLVFKYNRHAVFDVKIFGTNGCKKKLRVDSEEPSESEEAVDGTNRLKAKEPVPMETEVVSISDGEGKENGKEEEENGVEKVKKEEEEDDGVEEQGVQFDKRGTGVQKRKFNSTLFSDDVPRVTGATIHFLSSVAPVRTSLLVRLLVTDDHQIAEGPWVCPTVPYARSMKAAEITDEQYELLREAGIVIPRCPHFLVPSYENVRKNQLIIPKYLIQRHNIGMNRDIVFRDENGKQWPAKIYFDSDGRTKITCGWRLFCKEHNLCSNDKCLLELVLGSKNRCSEICVQIFRDGRGP